MKTKTFALLGLLLLALTPTLAQTPVKQSSTATPLRFLLVSSTDGTTPITGASVTVTLSKANATTFTAASGTVTEIGNGVYQVAGNASDTAVLGPLSLHATATGALPYDREFVIVGYDPSSAAVTLPTIPPTGYGGASAADVWAYTIKGRAAWQYEFLSSLVLWGDATTTQTSSSTASAYKIPGTTTTLLNSSIPLNSGGKPTSKSVTVGTLGTP